MFSKKKKKKKKWVLNGLGVFKWGWGVNCVAGFVEEAICAAGVFGKRCQRRKSRKLEASRKEECREKKKMTCVACYSSNTI
jgi:hypothetical protein